MKNKAIENDKKETPLKDVLKRERGRGKKKNAAMRKCEDKNIFAGNSGVCVCDGVSTR